MIDCYECGKQISENASACPNCGAKPKNFKWWLWYPLGGVAAMLLLGILQSNSPENDEKYKARGAISVCWQEYEKKSLDPAAKRFIAGVCEQMEQKFRDQYRTSP